MSGSAPVSLLVVDDEPANLRLATRYFGANPALRVLECASAESALVLLSEQTFEASFVDLCLGQESGCDVARAHRARNPVAFIVIYSGALRDPIHGRAAREAGANFFIPKPFDLDTVGKMIIGDVLLARDRALRAGPAHSQPKNLRLRVNSGVQCAEFSSVDELPTGPGLRRPEIFFLGSDVFKISKLTKAVANQPMICSTIVAPVGALPSAERLVGADAIIWVDPPTVGAAKMGCSALRESGLAIPLLIHGIDATDSQLDEIVSAGADAAFRISTSPRDLARSAFAWVRAARGYAESSRPRKISSTELVAIKRKLYPAEYSLILELNKSPGHVVSNERLVAASVKRAVDPEQAMCTHVSRARRHLATIGLTIRQDHENTGYALARLESETTESTNDGTKRRRRGRPPNA